MSVIIFQFFFWVWRCKGMMSSFCFQVQWNLSPIGLFSTSHTFFSQDSVSSGTVPWNSADLQQIDQCFQITLWSGSCTSIRTGQLINNSRNRNLNFNQSSWRSVTVKFIASSGCNRVRFQVQKKYSGKCFCVHWSWSGNHSVFIEADVYLMLSRCWWLVLKLQSVIF